MNKPILLTHITSITMENLLVYHVDIGRWITCDFSLLNQTVMEMKLQIEKKTDIPIDKQVLLVSGGGHLDSSKTVSCYCGGTKTSPFFLFSRILIDHSQPPSAFIHTRPDLDFTKEHHSTRGMPPTIEALNVTVSLSQQYSDNAQYILNCTKMLINDQHMMHHGWSAAVANMLDSVGKFEYKASLFENDFKCYLNGREDSTKLLNNFDNILKEISNIPMLPALLENNSEEQAQMNRSEANIKNTAHQSLLEWVTARQGLTNLEHMVEDCKNSIKQFDEEMLNAVLKEVSATKECSSRSDCFEIKGLEHRLFKLAQMIDESKLLATEQFNLAKVIEMNHFKAAKEGDKSVISVLIASHNKQLEMMNKNNVQLCDIRNRSIKAKQEFCDILHPRLKWLIVIENKVSDVEAIMLLYSDSIKLTNEYLDIVEQLYNTPKLYFNAVSEVVRRRIFSQALLIWSSDLACRMITCHSDEIEKRKHFQSQFEGHFLNSLFPGLEDMPPPFATRAPSIFDNNLPKLCSEDLDVLIKQLPQIAHETLIPDFNAIIQFFLSKSVQEDDTFAIELNNDHKSLAINTTNELSGDMRMIDEKLNEVMISIGLGCCKINMQRESDVNKMTNSEIENNRYNPDSFLLPHKFPGSQKGITDKLHKNNLYSLKKLYNSVNTLRKDLELIKQCFLQQNVEINMFTNDLKTKYDTLIYHLQQVLQFIENNNHELNAMRTRINELETLAEICTKSEKHEQQLRFRLENEKGECIQQELEFAQKEITKQIKLTHETEIEMIKAHYKLISQKSSTECSSNFSEQSLDKLKQKCDVIEIVNHEAIIAQIKEDFLLQKEQAIQDERMLCEQRLACEQQFKYENKKNDNYCIWGDSKKSIDDKITPLKHFKEKSTSELQLSSNSQSSRSDCVLFTESDLNSSLTSSSVLLDLSKSSSSESGKIKISVNSCNAGDLVFVVWDFIYRNYVVYQENKINLIFLHPDSIDNLSLKLSTDKIPKLQYFSAEVIKKEYCQAVTEDNRYRVEKGMKFYRVKIKLLKVPSQK